MKRILSTLILCIFAMNAHAEILFEPYVGYLTGTSKRSGGNDIKLKGLDYGARLGYATMGLSYGVEYLATDLSDDQSPSVDWSTGSIGAFAGYDFSLLRVFATYFFSHDWKAKSNGAKFDYSGGAQWKLGIGYLVMPQLSLNLEYLTTSHDEVDGASLSPERKAAFYGVSVSAPLMF